MWGPDTVFGTEEGRDRERQQCLVLTGQWWLLAWSNCPRILQDVNRVRVGHTGAPCWCDGLPFVTNTPTLTSAMAVTPSLCPLRFQCRVCWIHHVTGMWVYPFLEHIGSGARIIFFGSTTILMNFLYLLGEVLNSYIWDTQRSEYRWGRKYNNPAYESLGRGRLLQQPPLQPSTQALHGSFIFFLLQY